jgi:ubiquinone/menaquinone biosynthesis C-methylase UbiE
MTNLKQAYNNFAEVRDQIGIEPWKQAEREKFLELLKLKKKTTLLEIGAGPGRDSLYFRQHGLDVVATDFSEEMIRLCREKGLAALQMDFHHLDFAAETFDAVFALNCLLHVPKAELEGVLAEIHRVLKPNGLFFVGVYGGQDSEGVWEKDSYEPKRFFAMYEDKEIVRIVQRTFQLEHFHTVEMGAGAPHFQSIRLRKRANL